MQPINRRQYFPRLLRPLVFAGMWGSLLASVPVFAADEPVLQNPSSLRSSLPDQTLLYARIPLFSTLLGDKNHYFSDDDGSSARGELATLRNGLGTAINDALPAEAAAILGPVVSLMTENLAGPLELAVIPGAPMPALMISGQFDLDRAELESSFAGLSQNSPLFDFSGGIESDGTGTMFVAGMPFTFQYQDNTLRGVVSAAPTPLDSVFTGNRGLIHPMTSTEVEVDPDGNGTFIWVNAQAIMGLAAMMAPPEQVAQMNAVGITRLGTVSLGIGRGENQGRMLLSGTFTSPFPLLPEISNTMDFTTRGEPRLFTSFSIPDAAMVETWMNAIQAVTGPEFSTTLEQAEQQMGFSYLDLVRAFGPESAYYRDEAGDFTVLKIRDENAFNALLAGMEQRNQLELDTREMNGMTIHQATLSSSFLEDTSAVSSGASASGGMSAALPQGLFGPVQTFWVEENGYLIMASVPQPLIDRSNINDQVMASDWLDENLGQDFRSSMLTLTSRADHLPAKSYYFYLSTLLTLANMTESDIDIYAFPSARTLDLEDSASLGFQLDISPTTFKAGINYDSSLADLVLQGNPMVQAAMLGIVAAVALPAYQDYTLRTKVSEVITGVSALNEPLLAYYQQNNTFPGAVDSMAMLGHLSSDEIEVYMEPGNGTVYVELNQREDMLGQFLRLVPRVENQALSWTCEVSAGMSRYAPGQCEVVAP